MASAFQRLGAFFASVKGFVYMVSLIPSLMAYAFGVLEQLPWAFRIMATMGTLAFGLISVAVGVMVWERIELIRNTLRDRAEIRRQRKLWRDAKLHDLWESSANLINTTKDIMHGYSASDENIRRELVGEWRQARQIVTKNADIFLSDQRIFLSAQNVINRCDVVVTEAQRHGQPFSYFKEVTETAKQLWHEIEQ